MASWQSRRELDRLGEAERAAAAAERLHTEMDGKLWDRVYSRISRRDVADLWPTQAWKELGGVKPIQSNVERTALNKHLESLNPDRPIH